MIRSVLGKFWFACAGAIVLLAVLLTLVRGLLPYVDAWREEVEARLGAALGQDVSIGRLAAQWRGLAPQLQLEDLRIGGSTGGLRFAHAYLELDVPRSLLGRVLNIRKLVVTGLHLTVVREADGSVMVAGLGDSGGMRGGAMLPARGHLIAEDAEIRLIDRAAPGGASDLLFTDADLELWSAVGRHQLEGELTPPPDLGTRLRFALDLYAPRDQPWRVQLYVDGAGLPLRPWLAGRVPGLDAAGISNTSLWMDWDGGVLQRIDGAFTVRDLALARVGAADAADDAAEPAADPAANAGEAPAPEVEATAEQVPASVYTAAAASGLFTWRSFDGGWRVDVGDLVIDHGAGAAPPRRFALGRGQSGLEAGELVARMDALPVDEALRLAAFGGSRLAAEAIEGMHPRGMLRDIGFSLREADSGAAADDAVGDAANDSSGAAPAPRFRAQARFEDAGGEPWRGAPGFAGVSGDVSLDENGGVLDLQGDAVELAFARLFREPLPAQRLQARLYWERLAAGWRLRLPAASVASADLELDAWGRMDLPAQGGGSPVIALYANFSAPTTERFGRYLPAGVMRADAVTWLDRSIQGASVSNGALVLHGVLADFPYDHGEGLFRVDFDVHGGTLEYNERWPRIEDIDAHLEFSGRRMDIAARSARTLGAAIGATHVAIADLNGKPAVLSVRGSAHGPIGDGLAFLRDTPLAARFGPYVADVAARGNHRVDLSLRLPLTGKGGTVDGTVTFEDGTLVLGKDGIAIEHISGPLHFSDDGLSADGLKAGLLGLPATLSVSTAGEGDARGTRVDARGTIDGADAARLAHLPPRWLDGSTDWRARLVVPGVETIRSSSEMTLRVDSTLAGMAITLPAPLAKPAQAERPLLVSIPLPRSAAYPVAVELGERGVPDFLSIALGFDKADALDRGELRFGGGEAVLPESPGLRIAGKVTGFALAEWQRALDGEAGAAGQENDGQRQGAGRGTGAAPASLPVRAVDLAAAHADLFGRVFDEVEVSARPDDSAWHADVKSRQMAGRVDVPLQAGPPWRADLEYLHLAKLPAEDEEAPPEDGSASRSIDPRKLPAMRIASKSFSYGGTDFGTLSLQASPTDAGIRLEQLSLVSPNQRIEARGDWVQVGEDQYSSFTIDFDTADFGRALSGFGYADSIRGGKGRSAISARWSGAPTAFALARLQGSMEIEINDGRLLEVEPGAGRVFGLISLQALPRRLTLDFSDFFGKGFAFDRIGGTFTVRDGIAHTEDLAMAGPAARIEARGDVDLARRQYDQTVLVVPNVGSGLPLAGAVAGGVPIGAAMLLMERVFKDDIERMTRLHYRVTGSWHEPLVERLQDGSQSGKR